MSEKLTIRLKTLHCFQNDEEKFDDIFLKFRGKKVWPIDKKHEDVRINTKHALEVELTGLIPNEEAAIEVWDHDVISPNDLLGTAYIVPDKPGGPYTVDMRPINDKEIARYSIDWEILH
ncbi:MAG: hypothetical protein ABJH98_18955 [Reichenbachiella sp.]|uniref:hypothetical protein n=1 Tax=Reichenbachiella sp. TaxID=2184521 RepID=UPI0032980B68